MGKEKNFGDKQTSNGFNKNPQNINRNGRPRKNFKEVIHEYKELGLVPPTREEYMEVVGLMMVMTLEEFIEAQFDEQKPQWIRALIEDLQDKKLRAAIMTEYRDWMFGRAKQQTEISTPEGGGIAFVQVVNPGGLAGDLVAAGQKSNEQSKSE